MGKLQIVIEQASTLARKYKWAEVEGNNKIFACTEPQLDVLDSTAKFTFAFAGSGGGKTCLIGLWLYTKFVDFKKTNKDGFWRALVVSPTTSTFEKSQLKQHILNTFSDTVIEGKWNDQKKWYPFPGGEIQVVTAENDPKRLSGGQYNAIVLDECWQMRNADIWEEARRRSNICNAPVLGVTTPNCDGWIYEEVYQQWEKGDPDFYVRQWQTSENIAKTPEEHAKFLDSELQKLGQAKFDRMYGGQFSKMSGLVYDAFGDKTSASWPVIPAVERLPSPAVRVFGSIDFGWEDPAAAYIYVHCENDLVYIVDELFGSRIDLDALGLRLQKLKDKWSTNSHSRYADVIKGGFFDCFYCDTSRPEYKPLMARYGVPFKGKLIPMIEAGITIVDQLFRCNRVRVFDSCTNLIREAKAYAFDDKGKPREDNNHAMDSMRYGLSSYFANRTINYIESEMMSKAQADAKELEVAVRLGYATTKEDLERDQRKLKERKQAEWMQSLLWADDPD